MTWFSQGSSGVAGLSASRQGAEHAVTGTRPAAAGAAAAAAAVRAPRAAARPRAPVARPAARCRREAAAAGAVAARRSDRAATCRRKQLARQPALDSGAGSAEVSDDSALAVPARRRAGSGGRGRDGRGPPASAGACGQRQRRGGAGRRRAGRGGGGRRRCKADARLCISCGAAADGRQLAEELAARERRGRRRGRFG